jgi:ParB family chromosome partitioning protein
MNGLPQSKEAAVWMNIAALKPWNKNPKKHTDATTAQVARSIDRFDFIAPIVVWGSRSQIVAGHGRLAAAEKLMRADPGRLLSEDAPGPGMVPVRVVEFASESEAAQYAIADNRLTEFNPMSGPEVEAILKEIAEAGEAVEVPGYTEAELRAMLGPPPTGEEWAEAMGGLPSEGRDPIQVMTFTLHDDQAATVKRAVDHALSMGAFVDTGNENRNGNALARICETFLTVRR